MFREALGWGTLLILVGCGSLPTTHPPPPPPALRLEITEGATIQGVAFTEPAQQLVVTIRNAGENVPVQFQSVSPAGGTDPIGLGRLGGGTLIYSDTLTTASDAQGRIQVRLRLARAAGKYFIRITAPTLPARDSSTVIVQPDVLAEIDVAPNDTALLVGESFVARATGLDRWRNVRAGETFSTTVVGTALTVRGLTIVAAAIGRDRVRVTSGSIASLVDISVMPPGSITTIVPGQVLTMGTNATSPALIPFPHLDEFFGSALDWSSDGHQLVSDVFATIRVHGDDGSIRQLTAPGDAEVLPQFSADDQWIYFARQRSPVWELRRRRVDGSRDTLLLESTDPEISPAPNGSEAALVDSRMIWIVDLTTGQRRLVVEGHAPSWSPDGNLIAYRDPGLQVNLVHPDGSGQRRLAGTAGFGRPEWSSDSKYLAVGHEFAIAVVSVERGDFLPLSFLLWRLVTWRP